MACKGCKERGEMLRKAWAEQKAKGVVKAIPKVVTSFVLPRKQGARRGR